MRIFARLREAGSRKTPVWGHIPFTVKSAEILAIQEYKTIEHPGLIQDTPVDRLPVMPPPGYFVSEKALLFSLLIPNSNSGATLRSSASNGFPNIAGRATLTPITEEPVRQAVSWLFALGMNDAETRFKCCVMSVVSGMSDSININFKLTGDVKT